MWLHRIGGAALALLGLGTLVWLLALFYVPIPKAHETLLALGMPGVLLGGMFAIIAILFGLWFALAPAEARTGRGKSS